jgi:hypothetical protein
MAVAPGTYEDALATFGRARVFVRPDSLLGTDPLVEVTITEGAIRGEVVTNAQMLTLPEIAGETPFRKRSKTMGITVTIPALVTLALLEVTNARPSTSGQDDPTWGVLIIPEEELGAGVSRTALGVWTPAAPSRALAIFKATFTPLPYVYTDENVGKAVEPTTVAGMFVSSNPSGLEVFAFGEEIDDVLFPV